ncbi:MAG: SLBB domain-containing protein, partial [Clostridia bacterium]|nr:SLBB domain-containing protein [Clostridia bacterium]
TVDGGAIKEPKNLRVPIGTNIQDIIDFCGGFKSEPRKIISGGPMMGIAICDTNAPICKQNNAILAFDDRKDLIKTERECIRCGRCVDVCPMSLMPTLIERYARIKDADKLQSIGIGVCMECGSCAYACPSGRPLVQYMRLAKQVLREESAKK